MKKTLIKSIYSVIFVGPEDLPGQKKTFSGDVHFHELIFQLPCEEDQGYTVTFGNKTETVCGNSVRYLPVGTFGKYEVEHFDRSNGCIDVFFEATENLFPEMEVIGDIKSPKIELLFRRIFSVWISKEEGYGYEATGILYEILAELEKRRYLPENTYAIIAPAVRKLQEDLLDPQLRCEELAGLCGISYTYFKKLFEKRFGTSPKRYVMQNRLSYSADLLSSGRYSVAKISEMAGFQSPAYFSRVFTENMGVSPSGFIKGLRSN